MGYCKALDGMPKIVKILMAIFDAFWCAYRIVREAVNKNWTLMVWDIVFTVVWPVSLVMDLITVIKDNKPFDYATWFGSDNSTASSEKKDEKPAEEKKDDTAAK
jgi:hypothetical protein